MISLREVVATNLALSENAREACFFAGVFPGVVLPMLPFVSNLAVSVELRRDRVLRRARESKRVR